MIIRVFHARVRQGKQAEFKRIVELLSIPQVQSRNGMVAFYPGQPVGPDSNEFVLVTVWRDQTARKNLPPLDWVKKIIPEEALPLVEAWDLNGYEAFGIVEKPLKPLFNYMGYEPG